MDRLGVWHSLGQGRQYLVGWSSISQREIFCETADIGAWMRALARSGPTSEDVGQHELKGLPDRRRLHRVVAS